MSVAVKAAVAETAAAVEVAAVVVAKANAPMAAALVPVAVVANKPLARKVRVVLKAKVKDKAQDAVLTAIAPPSVMHNRAATKVGLPVVVAWVNPVHPALPPVANPTLCAPAWI